jgi:ABC-type Na+ efflux pump permease subunit
MNKIFKENWWVLVIIFSFIIAMYALISLKSKERAKKEERELKVYNDTYNNAYTQGQIDALEGKVKFKKIAKCDSVWVAI